MTKPSTPQGDCQGKSCGQKGPDPQTQRIETALSGIQNKLIVMSGKGGVGKSSVATYLSLALSARGFATGLLDVDLHGPSIAGMLGLKGLLEVNGEQQAVPKRVNDHLKVVSMQSLMKDPDQAVIWRGPAKTGVIQQFLSEVAWGTLDFLVVDSPPGTGDEPLSVAQAIAGARALIVTTPQDVAQADVRKSINFCRAVNLGIVGLVENMGPFACPCCGKTVELFKHQGGRVTAETMGIDFLGTLPFDPEVVKACDTGTPVAGRQGEAFEKALDAVVQAVVSRL